MVFRKGEGISQERPTTDKGKHRNITENIARSVKYQGPTTSIRPCQTETDAGETKERGAGSPFSERERGEMVRIVKTFRTLRRSRGKKERGEQKRGKDKNPAKQQGKGGGHELLGVSSKNRGKGGRGENMGGNEQYY